MLMFTPIGHPVLWLYTIWFCVTLTFPRCLNDFSVSYSYTFNIRTNTHANTQTSYLCVSSCLSLRSYTCHLALRPPFFHLCLNVTLHQSSVSRCDQIGLLLALSDRRSVPFTSLWRLHIFPPSTISHFYCHFHSSTPKQLCPSCSPAGEFDTCYDVCSTNFSCGCCCCCCCSAVATV